MMLQLSHKGLKISLFLCKSRLVESHKPLFLFLPPPSLSPPPSCAESQVKGTYGCTVCFTYSVMGKEGKKNREA